MRSYSIIIAIILGSLFGGAISPASAQDASVIKGALIIAFSDLVTWPSTPSTYTVGIQNDGEVARALEKLAGAIKSKTITVQQGDSGCQIVYYGSGSPGKVKPGVLTVGEGEDFTSNGGIIAFVIRDGKVKFIINKSNAEQAGLKLSPRLLSLAVQ